jgi:hypothetical protein
MRRGNPALSIGDCRIARGAARGVANQLERPALSAPLTLVHRDLVESALGNPAMRAAARLGRDVHGIRELEVVGRAQQ